MDVMLVTAVSFALLVASAVMNLYLGIPLAIVFALFFILALKRGHRARNLAAMALRGGRKAFIVIQVFLVIGVLIPSWIAAGTVPALVYHGLRIIRPNTFLLIAFLTSAVASTLIGTAVGTSGIVGIAFMLIARSGGANLAATAGAVISGAYFGDRCSPMSSSASLVAFLTSTDIYANVRNMVRTSIVPLAFSAAVFLLLSFAFPLRGETGGIVALLSEEFDLGLVALLPAIIVIGFSAFRVKVKLSMAASALAAFLVAVLAQHRAMPDLLRSLLLGFRMDEASPLGAILKGGGIVSMLKISLIVYIASSLTGIIEGTRMLEGLEALTQRATTRYGAFTSILATSAFAALIGGSQTVAVMLTHLANKKAYAKLGLDGPTLAIDLENTAILVPALVPWNLTLLAPVTILGASFACIPFLVFAWATPLWNLLRLRSKRSIFLRASAGL